MDLTYWKLKLITAVTHKFMYLFKPLDEIEGSDLWIWESYSLKNLRGSKSKQTNQVLSSMGVWSKFVFGW